MIPIGLRTLLGGLAPMGRKLAAGAMKVAKEAPISTAGIVGLSGLMAHDAATTSPEEAVRSANDRYWGSVETHKPHDAADAYMDDDFLRAAFKKAKTYDEYKAITSAMGESSLPFTEDEFEAVSSDPELAAKYVGNDKRVSMVEDNAEAWGEDWEQKALQDEFRKERARRYAMALQQRGGARG